MMVTAVAVLTAVVLVLVGLVYDLRARVVDLENQSDADLRVAAWEARATEAGWQQREGKIL